MPTKIVLVGAGRGGSLLLPIFHSSADIEVVGVADKNPQAPGLKIAERLNIPVTYDFMGLIRRKDIDVIVNVTGDSSVSQQINENKEHRVQLIGGSGAHLFWKLMEDERSRFAKLYEMGVALAPTENLEGALDTILKKAIDLTNTSAGSIALFDKKENAFYLAAHDGFSDNFVKVGQWKLRAHGLTRRILDNNGLPLAISDVSTQRDFDNRIMLAEGIRALVAVPLMGKSRQIVGIIYVDDFFPRDFTEGEIGFLSLLANKAAFAIQRIQLLQKLTNLVQTSPSAVMLIDENTNVDIFNAAAQHLLGYREAEVTGRPAELLYESTEEANAMLQEMRHANGKLLNFETRLKAKDGRLVPVLISASWLKDLRGSVSGTLIMSQDLTKNKQLEHKRDRLIQRLRSVHKINVSISLPFDLKNTLDKVISESLDLLDAKQGYILLADRNRNVLKALHARGIRKEDLPELSLDGTSSICSWVACNDEPYVCGDATKDPLYFTGVAETVSEIAVPLRYEGDVIGVLDIQTGRPNAFSEDDKELLVLIASQAAIAIKKGEFIKDLDEMYMSLTHASRLISVGEVAATVSHEVGNSLNIISLGIRNIKHNKAIRDCDEVQAAIDDIDQEIQRSDKVISQLTEYSRKAWQVTDEEIDVNNLVEGSLRLLRPRTRQQRVTLKSVLEPNLPKVRGNRLQLSEAVNNILLNALWAVGRKGNIDIRTSFDTHRKLVSIRIADDGVAILPQDMPNIFEPFFTTKPRGEGTGLGLYVTQKIIQRQGGKIEVQSKRGKGTTFHVNLKV